MKAFRALALAAALTAIAGAASSQDNPVKPKNASADELQRQVDDLKTQVIGWQSMAIFYRAKFQAEADAQAQQKAQADQATAKAQGK